MNIQTILVTLVYFLASIVAGGLIYLVSTKNRVPGVTAFLILTIALAEWSFTYGMEILSNSLAMKTVWAQFQYIGISIIPVGWFLFAQAYSGNEKWGSLPRIISLCVIPVITILAAFTNKWYGLIWAEYDGGEFRAYICFSCCDVMVRGGGYSLSIPISCYFGAL